MTLHTFTRHVRYSGVILFFVSAVFSSAIVHADTLPPYWDGRDIGAVGIPGSASWSNNTWSVAGSGADIWGTSDGFHYVSRQLDTDPSEVTTFVTRVVSQQNTSPFAKAGLMVRTSYDADAAHVILDVKPDGGVELMTRSTPGGSTTFVAGASEPIPAWLRLDYGASTVTGFISNDGTTWTQVGTVQLTGALYIGFAVTSHDNAAVNDTVFDSTQITVNFNSGFQLTSPWTQGDVGVTGLAGDASFSNGVYTVRGAGSDIWGTSDSFHFVYPATCCYADQILARVTSVQNTNPYAKAGIMIRDSLEPDSSHVVLDVRPDGEIEFMSRLANGATTTFVAAGTPGIPVWLKLSQAQGVVSGYLSHDGTNWSKLGDINVSLSSKYPGLVVTSHDPSTLNTATFDNVILTWSIDDIGGVGPTGNVSGYYDYTLSGSGADIWGTSDSFRYMHEPLSRVLNGGNALFATYFRSFSATNPFAKAGIMIRESTAPDAATVILDQKPDGGLEFMTRSTTGAAMTFLAGGDATQRMLELRVSGQTVTAYVCDPDSTNCQQVGSTTLGITPDWQIGYAITSHDPGALATATFR